MNESLSRSSAERIQALLKRQSSDAWMRVGKKRALALFLEAARRVPAYKDWLKKHSIPAARIKTWHDWQQVPMVTKQNYLRQYPLKSLCWDGTLKRPLVFTATSGSTGEPFYFPRERQILDWQYSLILESFLRQSTRGTNGPILVIICFGMGVWIGGLMTYHAFALAAERAGLPVSIITPGINKKEIWQALRELAPQFAETILVGYPPFLKDIVDEAKSERVALKRLPLRFVFAAEAITERFRHYLAEAAGIGNPARDMINIYGSADLGAMAFESGVSVVLKDVLRRRGRLARTLFPSALKWPTVAQFNPLFVQFEAPEGNILVTGNNTLPLVRYGIGDRGGVWSFTEMQNQCQKAGVNLPGLSRRAGLTSIPQLPFVYVFERSDFSTKLYGATIYPEHVRLALQHESLHRSVTGKFVLETVYDVRHNQRLDIHVELKNGVKAAKRLERATVERVVKSLLLSNEEYRNNFGSIPKKVTPRIYLRPHEHPAYFKPGIKQRWVN